jgi:uncharacterized protein (TIGR00369 family)
VSETSSIIRRDFGCRSWRASFRSNVALSHLRPPVFLTTRSREAVAVALIGQYDDLVPTSDQRGSRATRQGPFWDVLDGRRDPPPAAVLLGWKLARVDPDAETIEVSFTATEQFLNPAGDVQGGFLAAMLDDTLGPALVATLGVGQWAPTIDLQVQFLRPAKPGELRGVGRVVRRGREVAFLAGELRSADGVVVATATASAIIRSQRGCSLA